MEGSFVPECYFDTVLVKAILQTKEVVNHKKGCNEVMRAMKNGKLKDSFAVGIVDKDKTDLDYLREFDKHNFDKLNLYKHRIKPQFVIQFDPSLERWIIQVSEEAGIVLESFALPGTIEKLKKITKSELAGETKELKDLCKALINSNSRTIKRLSVWINYLKDNNYKADIKELINA